MKHLWSRQSELVNIQNWAQQNNLTLNCSKSCEIIFSDRTQRRRHAVEPLPLPWNTRSRSMKMLGVEIADDFTVTQHVQQLATSSSQTIYSTRSESCGPAGFPLRLCSTSSVLPPSLDWCTQLAHGVVSPKMLYFSPRHRIASESTRSSTAPVVACRHGYCTPDLPTFATLQTMNFPLKLPDCRTMSCMHYYHNHITTLWPSTTHPLTSAACTLNTLIGLTFSVLNFSHACYIKTNTRTTHILILFFPSQYCVY